MKSFRFLSFAYCPSSLHKRYSLVFVSYYAFGGIGPCNRTLKLHDFNIILLNGLRLARTNTMNRTSTISSACADIVASHTFRFAITVIHIFSILERKLHILMFPLVYLTDNCPSAPEIYIHFKNNAFICTICVHARNLYKFCSVLFPLQYCITNQRRFCYVCSSWVELLHGWASRRRAWSNSRRRSSAKNKESVNRNSSNCRCGKKWNESRKGMSPF